MTPLSTFNHEQRMNDPTHSFPSRTSPTRRTGVGHWLVAYRKTEERHYKNVHRRVKERVKEAHKKQENRVLSGGRTLNKDFLLRLHSVDEPCELSSVNLMEHHLHDVNDKDLNMFNNVIQIDASVNLLSLGHFKSFVSLRELNLSLNRLQDMPFDPADFPHLEVLDLSYNSLSTDAVTALGCLPCLKVLHLTENQLCHLPPDLSLASHNTTQQTSKDDTYFKSLEVLMLDDNKLSSDVFKCLRNLRRLRYLNLKGNLILEVPLLELLDNLKTQQTSTEQSEEERETDGNMSDNLLKLMQFFQHKDWDCKDLTFPFPELQFLNLSGNKIAEEEALLAVALFPMLYEIDISSNPLTTRRSGDPPLLTYYLQDKLGMKIKRKNDQEVKILTKVYVEPKWKLCEVIPNLCKKTQGLDHQTQAETKRETSTQLSSDQITEHKTEQPFFVTEIEADSELDTETRFLAKNTESTVDFKSSPWLMDVSPDLTSLDQPIGIQTAVRMLEHTLKNLNVYRDTKPKLDSIQTPYREREKRIKALPPPPALPLKQQSEQLDKMIEEIKLNRTTREVPLTKIIKREDGTKQEYKEAVSLLKDMKAKYKMVHRKTMEQAATLGSELPPN
ncbi:X-ray radiation resistance-associated protein 1 [Periophthalmus magnuspinnatus]|uniref:X-ray radiation resistance-associated protein 1 n=1 Tax=Periophthalmus magnuspinnatus TaxID=409849 RepID=UPI0024371DA9|nr:X-ray radiation resistance-associated protein 1 [Periophthalmus magnuspinnatus]